MTTEPLLHHALLYSLKPLAHPGVKENEPFETIRVHSQLEELLDKNTVQQIRPQRYIIEVEP